MNCHVLEPFLSFVRSRGLPALVFFFFQAEDGIRDRSPSRGLGDVYKRQDWHYIVHHQQMRQRFMTIAVDQQRTAGWRGTELYRYQRNIDVEQNCGYVRLSLIHISEPTRRTPISYAVFCLKKKKILENLKISKLRQKSTIKTKKHV